MVHETLTYFTGRDATNRSWQVGDRPTGPSRPADRTSSWLAEYPQESDTTAVGSGEQPTLGRSGFLRWKSAGQSGWELVEAVNPDPREGDPTRIAPAELELRLCAAPVLERDDATGGTGTIAGRENLVQLHEYGWYIIPFLLAMLLLESLYASHLSKRPVSAEGAREMS